MLLMPSVNEIPSSAWNDPSKFKDFEEKYKCQVCLSLSDTISTTINCGHILCSACAARCKQCPECKAEAPKVQVNVFASRVLAQLELKCFYHESYWKEGEKKTDGDTVMKSEKSASDKESNYCPEGKLPLTRWLEHCKKCEYRTILCTECTQVVIFSNLLTHGIDECKERIIKCERCPTMHKFSATADHFEKCEGVTIKCGHCKLMIKRIFRDSHNCPHQIVPCDMESFGCVWKGKRKEYDAHLTTSMPAHMKIMFNMMQKIKDDQAEIKKQQQCEQNECKNIVVGSGSGPRKSLVTVKPWPAGLPRVKYDTPLNFMWLALDHIISSKHTVNRPFVLAADKHWRWFLGEIDQWLPGDKVKIHFTVFASAEDEIINLYGGRIRPIFDNPDKHWQWFRALEEGSAIEFRLHHGTVWENGVVANMLNGKPSKVVGTSGTFDMDSVNTDRHNYLPRGTTGCAFPNVEANPSRPGGDWQKD